MEPNTTTRMANMTTIRAELNLPAVPAGVHVQHLSAHDKALDMCCNPACTDPALTALEQTLVPDGSRTVVLRLCAKHADAVGQTDAQIPWTDARWDAVKAWASGA